MPELILPKDGGLIFKFRKREDCNFVQITDFGPLDTVSSRRAAWKKYIGFMKWLEISGFDGWIAGVEQCNDRMRRFLKRIGAVEYRVDGSGVFFGRAARRPYGKIRA